MLLDRLELLEGLLLKDDLLELNGLIDDRDDELGLIGINALLLDDPDGLLCANGMIAREPDPDLPDAPDGLAAGSAIGINAVDGRDDALPDVNAPPIHEPIATLLKLLLLSVPTSPRPVYDIWGLPEDNLP
jgi:hypothetical protein